MFSRFKNAYLHNPCSRCACILLTNAGCRFQNQSVGSFALQSPFIRRRKNYYCKLIGRRCPRSSRLLSLKINRKRKSGCLNTTINDRSSEISRRFEHSPHYKPSQKATLSSTALGRLLHTPLIHSHRHNFFDSA